MNYQKHANKKKQASLHSIPKKTTKKVGITLIKIFVFSFLMLMIVGLATGIGVAKAIIDSAPKLNLSDVTPEGYTSMVLDLNGNEIQQLHSADANRIYVELDLIPKNIQNAVVAIEDKRFWAHNGIDIQGIFRAIFSNIKEGDLVASGASTLTQQLIKNTALSTEKKFKRKIQEQYLAIQLEKEIDKEKILELYLNTAPFGRGTNGVQTAANYYFNKDVLDVTIAEAAVIAAITQRPTYFDPVINPDNNRDRQLTILNEMLKQGYISQAEHDDAVNEDVYAHIQIANKEIDSQSDYSYFVDDVIDDVVKDLEEQKGYTQAQAYNLVYRGGISIYITQDQNMQAIADGVFTNEENFPPPAEMYAVKLMYSLSVQTADGIVNHYDETQFDTDAEAQAHLETLKVSWVGEGETIIAEKALFIPQPQAAMVIMDYHTGYVKVIVGGRGQKIGNQTFNRATQATRQPGSTFKVLAAYLPAIDTMGFTLGTVLDDVPLDVVMGNGATYSPKNWYNTQAFNYRGLTPVRTAIQDSMNICAVKTLNTIGIQTGFDYLLSLGFTTLVDSEVINGQTFTDKNLPLALGGITHGVSPFELTAAYGAIANGGKYVEPILYTRVLDHDGSILLNNEPEEHMVMKATTSFLLTSALQSVITSGTGKLARFKEVKMPIAGKTGTTSDDVDLLLAAFTPYYVGTVWLGYDENKDMNYSYGYHSVLWREVMEKIHADLPYKEFEMPTGIVKASICSESGLLGAPGLCDQDPRGSTIISEYFATSTVPTDTCNVHTKGTICKASGLFASEFCPADQLVERVMIKRPIALTPESWDPQNPPRISDRQYELPPSMIGEFCKIHGPIYELPVIDLPGIDLPGNPDDSKPANPKKND